MIDDKISKITKKKKNLLIQNNIIIFADMVRTQEYIEYLKSFKNSELNEKIYEYNTNKISFNELEIFALDNDCLSMRNYIKTFQIGKLLS